MDKQLEPEYDEAPPDPFETLRTRMAEAEAGQRDACEFLRLVARTLDVGIAGNPLGRLERDVLLSRCQECIAALRQERQSDLAKREQAFVGLQTKIAQAATALFVAELAGDPASVRMEACRQLLSAVAGLSAPQAKDIAATVVDRLIQKRSDKAEDARYDADY